MSAQAQYITIPAVVVAYTAIIPPMYLEKGLDDGIWRGIKTAHDRSYTTATLHALGMDLATCIVCGCICHSCYIDSAYKTAMTQ